jgi:hypothetical protein
VPLRDRNEHETDRRILSIQGLRRQDTGLTFLTLRLPNDGFVLDEEGARVDSCRNGSSDNPHEVGPAG